MFVVSLAFLNWPHGAQVAQRAGDKHKEWGQPLGSAHGLQDYQAALWVLIFPGAHIYL